MSIYFCVGCTPAMRCARRRDGMRPVAEGAASLPPQYHPVRAVLYAIARLGPNSRDGAGGRGPRGREPRRVRGPGEGGPGPTAALAAKAALESLALGQTVELRQRQPVSDRYGRILAFISLPETVARPEAAEPSIAHA